MFLSILSLVNRDPTLLDPLLNNIPAALNGSAVKNEICAQCAELEVLYSDPEVFREILGSWAEGMAPVWQRKADAIAAEYNITENYDRSEEWTDTGSSDSENKSYYKGYPVNSDMVNQNRTDGKSKAESKHVGRVHGNIGVRSAQELVVQELDLADRTNLQQQIVNDFKNRFCLLVY